MYQIELIYLILPLIVIVQTIIGVGVLVLGTPILLLLDFEIISILSLLLPISLITSSVNLILMKYSKKYNNINLEKNIKKNFFIFCLPSIIIGLYLLSLYSNYLNFKILISTVIIFSLCFKIIYKKIFTKISTQLLKFFMFSIGVIHGLTNSGGTLLMLFLNHINKKKIHISRQNTTYFYFYLVIFQYAVFNLFFYNSVETDLNLIMITLVIVGIVLGNVIERFINIVFFQLLVNVIAFIAAISLLIIS